MKAAEIKIEDKTQLLQNIPKHQLDEIHELLAVLDEDIRNIQQSLSRLNELRSLVVKRDDTSLAKLLEDIQVESDSYTANEIKRNSIRKELAIALNCNIEQITLSGLEAVLPKEKSDELALKKNKLRELTKQLKKEYLSTTLLLTECARFNNLLLKNVFQIGKTGTVTYGCDGHTKRQDEMAFVNLRF